MHDARHGRDGRGGGVLFETSAVAAAARKPVRHYREMSEFARHAKIAVQHLAAGNNAAADAGAEREQHQIVYVAAGAHPLFSEGRRVGVVFEDDPGMEPSFHFIAKRKILEAL